MNEQQIFDPMSDEAIAASQKISKKFAVVAVSIFLSLIMLPTLLWGALSLFAPSLVDELDFDTGENRAKAEMPEEIDLSTLTADVEAYYNDRVPFRSVLYSFQNDMFHALEEPYTEYVLPFLTDLFYSDYQSDTPSMEEESRPNVDDLFGESDTLPDVQIGEEGDRECEHELQETELLAASCQEFGKLEKKCVKCGYSEIHFTAKTDHKGAHIQTVASTYEEYGYKLYECMTCKKEYKTDFTKRIDTSYMAPVIKGPADRGVILGRYNWLFYTGNNTLAYYQGTNVLTTAQMKEYTDVLNELQSLCDQRGIELAFLCMPNREVVYSEYMPTYKVSTPRRLDVFTDYVEANTDLKYVYPLEEMLAFKPHYQTHYKHDTHWNPIGAFVGTQALYQKLGLPTTNLLDLKVTHTMVRTGDIFGIGGLDKNDYPLDYAYSIDYHSNVSYTYEYGKHGQNLVITNAPKAANDKNLVLFGDSFRGAMAPFLYTDFTRCTISHRDMLCSNMGKPVSKVEQVLVDEILDADILVITSVERYDYNIINQAKEIIKILKAN